MSTKIQAVLQDKTFNELKKYMEMENISNVSMCCADLIAFALLIKMKSKDEPKRTNREILEELLKKTLLIDHITTQTYGQAHVFPESITVEKVEFIRNKKELFIDRSNQNFNDFMKFKD